MKLIVVIRGAYEDRDVVGVFSTLPLALAAFGLTESDVYVYGDGAWDTLPPPPNTPFSSFDGYSFQEYTVDQSIYADNGVDDGG